MTFMTLPFDLQVPEGYGSAGFGTLPRHNHASVSGASNPQHRSQVTGPMEWPMPMEYPGARLPTNIPPPAHIPRGVSTFHRNPSHPDTGHFSPGHGHSGHSSQQTASTQLNSYDMSPLLGPVLESELVAEMTMQDKIESTV